MLQHNSVCIYVLMSLVNFIDVNWTEQGGAIEIK